MKKIIFLLFISVPRICLAQDLVVQNKVLTAYILVQKYINEDTSVQKPFAVFVRSFAPPKFGELTTYITTNMYTFGCQCLPAQNVMLVIPEKTLRDLPKHVFEPVALASEGMFVIGATVKANEDEANASELISAMVQSYLIQKYGLDVPAYTLHMAGNAWRIRFSKFYKKEKPNTIASSAIKN